MASISFSILSEEGGGEKLEVIASNYPNNANLESITKSKDKEKCCF